MKKNIIIKAETANFSIKISENVKCELTKGPNMFLDQFYHYKELCDNDNNIKYIIFCFVFLQIYIECFLHYNIRNVVKMEFKSPRDSIKNSWVSDANEGMYIRDKITAFAKLFFNNGEADSEIKNIIDNFQLISDIRNSIAHGHEISEWADSSGQGQKSETMSYLNILELEKQINNVNNLGNNWNLLLNKIYSVCVNIKDKNLFKFKKI